MIHLDKNCFNRQFLEFRTRYYFNETRELLARHKLLTAFIICLFAPGVKSIQAIGIPFYALVDPTASLKIKLMYLISICFFLLIMTQAQLSFIKGGAFREYLYTLNISDRVHKLVDFVVLVFSLNIVWLAVVLGGITISYDNGALVFFCSQYCLYVSCLLALCVFILGFIYKEIVASLIVFLAILGLLFISIQGRSWLNYSVGLGVFLLCAAILARMKPCKINKDKSFARRYFYLNNSLKIKNMFIIQLAVVRKNKRLFLIRFVLCFSLSMIMLNREVVGSRYGIALVLVGLQTYIFSTLFTHFEKDKRDHALFHAIFPYQTHIQSVKEIMLVSSGLGLALMPIFLFYNVRASGCFLLVSTVVLVINRAFYAKSLRFCLFGTLVSTAGACVVLYFMLGAGYA